MRPSFNAREQRIPASRCRTSAPKAGSSTITITLRATKALGRLTAPLCRVPRPVCFDLSSAAFGLGYDAFGRTPSYPLSASREGKTPDGGGVHTMVLPGLRQPRTRCGRARDDVGLCR